MMIPEEIVLQILSRLSTLLVVRFMAVSRSWLNLVSSQYFRNLHTSRLVLSTDRHRHHRVPLYFASYRTRANQSIIAMSMGPTALFVKRKPSPTLYMFRDFLVDHGIYTGTARHYCKDYVLSNTCNGLVCVVPRDDHQSVVVCNPLTLEFTLLPPITTVLSSSAALAFCPSTNQYKVVAIGYEPRCSRGRVLVHTLGCSSEPWRQLQVDEYKPFYRHEGPMHLDCNVYWLTDYSLVAFNLKSEKLTETKNSLRNNLMVWHLRNTQLLELGGKISVAYREPLTMNIWVLERFRGHWAWRVKLDLFHIRRTSRVFGLREDNEGIVSIVLKDYVILYDEQKKARGKQSWCEVRHLRLRRSSDDLQWEPCLSYEPSFVSLEQLGCETMRMEERLDVI